MSAVCEDVVASFDGIADKVRQSELGDIANCLLIINHSTNSVKKHVTVWKQRCNGSRERGVAESLGGVG